MADNQDKLTPSDEAKLAELEKQLAKDKTQEPAAKKAPATPKSGSGSSTDTVAKKITTNKTTTAYQKPKELKEATSKTGLLWFFTLVNLLILIGLIGAGYWTWLQWQNQNQQQTDALTAQQNSVKQQQSEIERSIASNQLAKGDIEQQNIALQSSMQSLVEQLQQTDAQVKANQGNLADLSGRRPADWLLAEADYLVRMAGRKLWLEHDVKTAIMMLQSADSRIQDLDDPSLLPLRAKLVEDLQTLQQINQVSTSTIALALGAMLKQVDNLPLAFFKKPEPEVVDESVTESIDDWQSNLARNWQEFTKNFFSVERVTTEIKPFMSEQQQWLSKEQLKFALLKAQVAVLRENSTLYQQSLQTAFSLLIESFDTEQDSVVQFTESLSNLQLTDFERIYPEQFNVAPLLQDVIEQRLNNRFVNGNNAS
jgi:uroporphyrin-3 C-methyltransferase